MQYGLKKLCYACEKITGIFPGSTRELKMAMTMHDQRLLLKYLQ